MKIGYLGVGTIASCMIEGFLGLDCRHRFFLSPRNAQKSAKLAKKYSNCRVCASNQEVLDNSDIVFISMNASSCPQALTELSFRKDHMIINLIATIPADEVRAAIGEVGNFSHVVPLPFVESRIGPIAAYPESAELFELLSPLGTVVFTKNMDDIRTIQVITSLMSTYYQMLHHLMEYADSEGMDADAAKTYTASFFGALSKRAESFEGSFRDLALEATPGGLNEFCLKQLGDSGVIKAWADILPDVMRRIKP